MLQMHDDQTTLGAIADAIFSGKAVSRLKPGGDAVPIVNMRDIDVDIAPLAKLDSQDDVSAADLAHLRLMKGDVVMTSRGAVRVGVATLEHAGAIPGANTVVVRLPPHIPPKVVAAYLRHPRIEALLLREFTGSTTAGFSIEGLKKLSLNLPEELELQQMNQMIDAADRYYTAMLEAANARRDLALELVARNLSPAGEAGL
jgi:hypothetical protein